MSYVITVQRDPDGAPLTRSDINAVLDSDETIGRKDERTAEWTRPGCDEPVYFNIEETSLWTDGYQHFELDALLAKLQELARSLDAEVIGEEGEVLTAAESEAPAGGEQAQSASCRGRPAAITGVALSVVAFPFVVILFVIRIPYLLWQIFRATR